MINIRQIGSYVNGPSLDEYLESIGFTDDELCEILFDEEDPYNDPSLDERRTGK